MTGRGNKTHHIQDLVVIYASKGLGDNIETRGSFSAHNFQMFLEVHIMRKSLSLWTERLVVSYAWVGVAVNVNDQHISLSRCTSSIVHDQILQKLVLFVHFLSERLNGFETRKAGSIMLRKGFLRRGVKSFTLLRDVLIAPIELINCQYDPYNVGYNVGKRTTLWPSETTLRRL